MTLDLTPEEWAQVRYEYEHTDKPVGDICGDHGFSPNTLRDRVRRWGWTPRRLPVAAEGPPPVPAIAHAAPLVPTMTPIGAASPEPDGATGDVAAPSPVASAAPADETPPDPAVIGQRLRGAVARVLLAIEATAANLAAGPTPPREMERAARTLSSLTRTLRALNGVLSQYPAPESDRGPEDPDEFALMLLLRLEAFKAARAAQTDGSEQPDMESKRSSLPG